VKLLEAVDFDGMATPDLFDAINRIRTNFVVRTHMEVSIINIAADLFMRDAMSKLTAAGLNPVGFLAPASRTAFEQVLADAAAVVLAANRLDILAEGLGHRSTMDYELALPRYGEIPSKMKALAQISSSKKPEADLEALKKSGKAALQAVQVAQRFEVLKEDAKHHSAREIAILRRALMALDRRLGLNGLSFHLTFDEIASMRSGTVEPLRVLAGERKRLASVYAEVPALPVRLTVSQLEEASAGIAFDDPARDGKIIGTRVSGSGVIEGRACVVSAFNAESSRTIPGFCDGDIVVSNMVPPEWIPYFGRAGGFVCEIGSWLSHTAIVARESGVPLIVGAEGLEAIIHGMQLRLCSNGLIEIIAAAPITVAAE
jgi:rifampicin phosphotransferase